MGNFGSAMVAAGTAIVTLALVAVLVSNRAKTSQVIQASGSAFSNVIQAATNPFGAQGPAYLRPAFGDF